MAGIEAKSLGTPDEVRTPAKTKIDVVHVGATEVGRFIAPGHDVWVLGDEPFVGIEFKSAATYAKS